MCFQHQNQTRFNFIDSTNKNYKNKFSNMLKQHDLVKRKNTIIKNINKLKISNSEIIPVYNWIWQLSPTQMT